jgi:DNA-binding NarL/FixJ family response regulator
VSRSGYIPRVNSSGGTPGEAVRIALVNDHEIVVKGLERMLEDFSGRVQVVELDVQSAVVSPVDVALYDTFSVTQVDESDVDRVIRNPRVREVAVYSWNMHDDLIQAALRKGIRGYLSKSLAAPALVEAIERVAAGEEVVLPQSDVGRASSVEVADGDWPGRADGLSARQAEVVALITMGFSNQQIAERTHLTMNTVKTYIRMAYRQMGVSSRTQAVLWGIEHGMAPSISRVRR